MRRILTVLVGLCLIAAANCAWSRPFLTAVAGPLEGGPNTSATQQPSTSTLPAWGELGLAKALELTIRNNPALAAFAEEVRARDAAALQAGLRANPELTVEVENFAGQDELEGFDGAETTIAISQALELGGKRGKRRRLAGFEKDLAAWDYQSKKLDVLASTAQSFIRVLVAQEQLTQSEELARLSAKTLDAVTARVDAGKVPAIEQIRARVELASARTEVGKARRTLEAARRRLAAFWDADRATFSRVIGNLAAIAQLSPEEKFERLQKNNPDLARWGSELEQRQATFSLAHSQAVPDLTLSLGIRNLQESDNHAMVAGIEFPLPFFDRNQGAIGEARAALEKARLERQAAETAARTALAEAWQSLAAAHAEVTTLRDEILPGAQSAFEAAEFGYREGKFDFLQMLDAQRTLFEVKGQYLQALASYHQSRAEVNRLTGSPQQGLLSAKSE